MFEKKRNSILKVIVILIIIVMSNIIINVPHAEAGRWRYQYAIEDIYNITQSSDDAVAVINNYFASDGETITLKSNIYDSIIGLRFDNIVLPWNSTHQYRVQSAFLSLYSDHEPLSYELESEKVSIYFERDNYNIQTFSNYTEMISRVPSYNYRNWDLDDVHGGKWNDSPNIGILVNGATGFDNDTICFLIYSDRGIWFRYFNTIDSFVDYAPRLHIISYIYEYEEEPPSGAEDSEFIETYRDLDIWMINRTGWVNYTNGWTVSDASDFIDVENSTYVLLNNIENKGDSAYIGKVSTSVSGNVKFGLNVTGVIDGQSSSSEPLIVLYGFGTQPEGLGNFYEYNGNNNWFIGVAIYDSDADGFLNDYFRFGFICYDEMSLYYPAKGMNYSLGVYWLDLNYDFSNKDISINIYNESDMSTLLEIRELDNYVPLENSYEDEYAFNTIYDLVGVDEGYVNGSLKSLADDFIYYVTDEDENIIVELTDPDITIEDVRAWIDNYLSASSEYDKTPWMGDFTLLLVGLVGVAFIPLGFLIFVSSVRDGDIIGGLQTLVLMFFIGIGCIVAWLWG